MNSDLRYILFEYWPGIWIYFCIWCVATFFVVRHLFRRRDCYSCTRFTGLLRSALLAMVVTPSIISDFFIVFLPAPALMGFLFMLPAILSPQHWDILPAIGLFYILPWIIATSLIYLVWCILRKQKTAEQSDPPNHYPRHA